MSGWLPGWTRVDNPRSSGGTYATDYRAYPWRFICHTTQGGNMPNVAAHKVPPHLWYDPRTRQKLQTVPLDRASFAMYNADPHPEYTNKACAIQVELVGYADDAAGWPDKWLRNIAEDVLVPVCQWLARRGARIDLGNVPPLGVIPGSSYEDAPQRLSWEAWANFDGVCGHRHVPGNGDRYDAGLLDMARIGRYAAELLGGGSLTVEEDLTPEQAKQLADSHGLLKALTPYLQATFNHATWTWQHLEPGREGNADDILRDTFNNSHRTRELLEALEAGENGDPVVDVSASLELATVQQLSAALNKKLSEK